MITLAFVGAHYPAQIDTNPEQLSGLQVVYAGDSLQAAETTAVPPRVLVLALEDLGPDPRKRLEEVRAATGAERLVVTYGYARREDVNALTGVGVQVAQGPLSLSNLRALLTDLIIRDILTGDAAPATPKTEAVCPTCGGDARTNRRPS